MQRPLLNLKPPTMKFLTFTTFLHLICVIIAPGQAPLQMQNVISGNQLDEGIDVVPAGQGFIILGETQSFGAGGRDILITHLDSCGQVLWSRAYGGSAHEWARDIEITANGNFVVIGRSNSFGFGLDDILVFSVDANGNVLWSRVYGGSLNDAGRAVIEAPDGTLYATGGTWSIGHGLQDQVIMRLAANGNLLWFRSYGTDEQESGVGVELTNDGCMVVGANYDSINGHDLFITRMQDNGNRLWERHYGEAGTDGLRNIDRTMNGEYVVCGHTTSFGGALDNGLICRIDLNGNLLSSAVYSGPQIDFLTSIQEAANGDLISSGYTYSFGNGMRDALLIRTAPAGNLQWAQAFGGAGIDGATNSDNRGLTISGAQILLANYTQSLGPNQDLYFIRTALNFTDTCNSTLVSPTVTFPTLSRHNRVTYVDSTSDAMNISLTVTAVNPAVGVLCTSCSSLPIRLMSFVGSHQGSANVIQWTTAAEIGNSCFAVERGLLGDDFTEIGRVDAVGLSFEPQTYVYRDYDVVSQRTLYRLKQIDINGQYTLSDIIEINAEVDQLVADVFPNPVSRGGTEQLSVRFNLKQSATMAIHINDLLGRTVLSFQLEGNPGLNMTTISIGHLIPGEYHLVVECDSRNESTSPMNCPSLTRTIIVQ